LILGDDLVDEGVLGREDHVGRAVEGVRARGEDGDLLVRAVDAEVHFRTFAAAIQFFWRSLMPSGQSRPSSSSMRRWAYFVMRSIHWRIGDG
jgi:hypothetical protein